MSKSPDQDLQKKIPCKEAIKNLHRIKVGMKESEIIELIGVPQYKSGDKWSYDFFECAPPPAPGVQSFIGGTISFKEKVVIEINWAWIDATGPGNNSPVPKKKKRNNSKQRKGGNIR